MPLTDEQLVERLKKAAENKAFHDVASELADRKRARDHITLYALTREMQQEGFDHDAEEYADVLETLAELGIGKLKKSADGKIEALTDIRVTLKSVGEAVLKGSTLKEYQVRQRQRAKARPQTLQSAPRPSDASRQPRPWQTPGSNMVLTFIVDGDPVNIPIPQNFSNTQIAKLVERLRETPSKKPFGTS